MRQSAGTDLTHDSSKLEPMDRLLEYKVDPSKKALVDPTSSSYARELEQSKREAKKLSPEKVAGRESSESESVHESQKLNEMAKLVDMYNPGATPERGQDDAAVEAGRGAQKLEKGLVEGDLLQEIDDLGDSFERISSP